jgi:hypothetical protein
VVSTASFGYFIGLLRSGDVSIPLALDSERESRNFEMTGKTAYLHFTRHNSGQGSLDRDLVRVPVEIVGPPWRGHP